MKSVEFDAIDMTDRQLYQESLVVEEEARPFESFFKYNY